VNDEKNRMAARCIKQAFLLERAALVMPNADPLTFQLKDVAQDLRDAALVLTQDLNPKEHVNEE
jgi:hypothetical protein